LDRSHNAGELCKNYDITLNDSNCASLSVAMNFNLINDNMQASIA